MTISVRAFVREHGFSADPVVPQEIQRCAIDSPACGGALEGPAVSAAGQVEMGRLFAIWQRRIYQVAPAGGNVAAVDHEVEIDDVVLCGLIGWAERRLRDIMDFLPTG